MDKIKILITDDHSSVRRELRSFLSSQSNFDIVGEACNGAEAVQFAAEFHPDLILMDIGMPTMNGLEAAKAIIKKHPYIKILFLSVHKDEEYVIESYKIGAKGYILKDAPLKDLVEAIESVNRGERYFRPTISLMLKNPQNTALLESF
jgi:DNA-binding NarL/FixJ family response regulator